MRNLMSRNRRLCPHPERLTGKFRMRQFVAYLRKVIKLPTLAEQTITDSRQDPTYSGGECFLLTIVMLVLRIRSFNQFEPRLADPAMKKLFGAQKIPVCVDTIAGALSKMDLETLETLHQEILKVAVRNKALRATFHRGKRFFGFDGFESIRSRKRACDGCQTATFTTPSGEVTDYYHRFVFLSALGPQPQLILGFQPQHSHSQRKEKDSEALKAEGELTAIKPLVNRLRKLFPFIFSVGVGDALYANEPMINFMKKGSPAYDLIAVLKKEKDEPMADAITIFSDKPPSLVVFDQTRQEYIALWDAEGFESLDSTTVPLRVIKALVHPGPAGLRSETIPWESDQIKTWWIVTTIEQQRLNGPEVVDACRHRWDKENEFCELTLHWFIKHCYLHHEIGTTAIMYAFMIAYNRFQLFLYRCLRHFTHGKTTALAIAEELKLDYAQITTVRHGFFPPATA